VAVVARADRSATDRGSTRHPPVVPFSPAQPRGESRSVCPSGQRVAWASPVRLNTISACRL